MTTLRLTPIIVLLLLVPTVLVPVAVAAPACAPAPATALDSFACHDATVGADGADARAWSDVGNGNLGYRVDGAADLDVHTLWARAQACYAVNAAPTVRGGSCEATSDPLPVPTDPVELAMFAAGLALGVVGLALDLLLPCGARICLLM